MRLQTFMLMIAMLLVSNFSITKDVMAQSGKPQLVWRGGSSARGVKTNECMKRAMEFLKSKGFPVKGISSAQGNSELTQDESNDSFAVLVQCQPAGGRDQSSILVAVFGPDKEGATKLAEETVRSIK
jgi:hypothetical protein